MVLKSFFSTQFLRFIIAGGISAGVNYSVGWILSGTIPFYGDIVVGYLAGMITAFVLFERGVFGEHRESRLKSIQPFVLINLAGLLQTWIVYAMLKSYVVPKFNMTSYADEFSRLVAIGIPIFTSFVGHKFYTFRQ